MFKVSFISKYQMVSDCICILGFCFYYSNSTDVFYGFWMSYCIMHIIFTIKSEGRNIAFVSVSV